MVQQRTLSVALNEFLADRLGRESQVGACKRPNAKENTERFPKGHLSIFLVFICCSTVSDSRGKRLTYRVLPILIGLAMSADEPSLRRRSNQVLSVRLGAEHRSLTQSPSLPRPETPLPSPEEQYRGVTCWLYVYISRANLNNSD